MKSKVLILITFITLFSLPICSAPLLMWHFDEVHSQTDLHIDHHEDVNISEVYGDSWFTGYAVGFSENRLIAILTPLLVIPFIIIILLFFAQFGKQIDTKDQDEVDEETDEQIVEKYVVDELIKGSEESEIRKSLETRGYDPDIINKTFDELEDDSEIKV